jgi:hypothetical protein
MTKLIVLTHNVETGEITEREATAQEIAQQEIDEANFIARQAEIKAKAQAKAALLERLGISEDEARLLLT